MSRRDQDTAHRHRASGARRIARCARRHCRRPAPACQGRLCAHAQRDGGTARDGHPRVVWFVHLSASSDAADRPRGRPRRRLHRHRRAVRPRPGGGRMAPITGSLRAGGAPQCPMRRAAPRPARAAGRQKKKPPVRPQAERGGGGGICQWTPVRAYVPGVVARLRCRDAGIGVTVARSGRCAVVVDADDAPDVVPAIRLRRSSRSAPPSPPRAACSASRTPICRARCGAASTPHPPARRRRCASSSTPGATRSGSMTTGASSSPTPGADDAPARAAPPPPPALRP